MFWWLLPADSIPCHKAQIIPDWCLECDNEIPVLEWSLQSPDYNSVEHVWDVQPTYPQQLSVMPVWSKWFSVWCISTVTDQKKNKVNWLFYLCFFSSFFFCRPSGWSRPPSWRLSLILREEVPVMSDRSQTLLHMLLLASRYGSQCLLWMGTQDQWVGQYGNIEKHLDKLCCLCSITWVLNIC